MTTYKVYAKNKKEENSLLEFLKKTGIKSKVPSRPNNQKKGKAFEKEISKELSLWWSIGKRDDIFYCTAGSGSRFTSRKKRGNDTANSCGDLSYTDSDGKPFMDRFSVELKNGYSDSLDLLSIIDSENKNHMLMEWVTKAKKEIEEAGREQFLIIFKRDRKNKVVCIDSRFLEQLDNEFRPDKELLLYLPDMAISVIDYDVFFKHFSPADLLK